MRLIAIICALIFTIAANATTYTTVAAGAWGTAANWDANGVPPTPTVAGDIINVVHNMTAMPNQTVTAGSTLNINSTVTTTGNLTVQGTVNIAATGTFTKTTALIISGNGTLNNAGTISTTTAGRALTFNGSTMVNNTGTISPTGLLTVGGSVSLTNSSTITAGAGFTYSSSSLTSSTSGTINTTGATAISAGGLTISGMMSSSTTVTTSGTAAVTINNGGTLSSTTATAISGGTLTVNAGGTLSATTTLTFGGAVATAIEISGTVQSVGTITVNNSDDPGSVININNGGILRNTGAGSDLSLLQNNTINVKAGGSVEISDAFTSGSTDNDFNMEPGSSYTGTSIAWAGGVGNPTYHLNGTIDLSGDWTATFPRGMSGAPTIDVENMLFTNYTGTLNFTGGKIDVAQDATFSGGGTLNFSEIEVGDDLTLGASSVITFNDDVTVHGDVVKSGNSTITVKDDFDVSGHLDFSGGGTFTVDNTGYLNTANAYLSGNSVITVNGFLNITTGVLALGYNPGGPSGIGTIIGTGVIGFDTLLSRTSTAMIICSGAGAPRYDGLQSDGTNVYPPANPLDLTTCALGSLPVKLIFFQGKYQMGSYFLTWETLEEKNAAFFIIQKSPDGKKYEDIGEVPASGSTNTRESYSYIDNDFEPGSFYYRLKQVDYNGDFNYSNVVLIDSRTSDIKIFPQPVSGGSFNIDLSSNLENGTYIIRNISGKVMQEGVLNGGEFQKIELTSEFLNGLYFIQINLDSKIITEKLLISGQ